MILPGMTRAGPASFLCCAANSFWPTRTGPMAMMYLTVLPFTLTMCPSIRSRPKPRSYWPATVTPVLKDTLAESEKSLDELLQKDPQCLRENRGTKGLVKGNQSFDDRTYVRFAVF